MKVDPNTAPEQYAETEVLHDFHEGTKVVKKTTQEGETYFHVEVEMMNRTATSYVFKLEDDELYDKVASDALVYAMDMINAVELK